MLTMTIGQRAFFIKLYLNRILTYRTSPKSKDSKLQWETLLWEIKCRTTDIITFKIFKRQIFKDVPVADCDYELPNIVCGLDANQEFTATETIKVKGKEFAKLTFKASWINDT